MKLRDQVRHELDALQERARRVDIEALRDGSWLVPVVRDALGDEAVVLDRGALELRHDLTDTEALADACIVRAQRLALLAGGLSAGAYATVVVGALATGGAAAGLAIPTAVAAFSVDLWFTARTQLRLAWELAVVYDHPVSLDDDAHLVALCRLAFGVDAAAAAAAVVGAVVPEVSRFTTRALTTTTRLASQTVLRGLGRTVAQRGLVRYAVPALGVPLCAAVNHISTGRTGRAAQALLRGHAQARRLTDLLEDELQAAPALVLACMLWIVGADERARGVEVALVRGLTDALPDSDREALDRALAGGGAQLLRAVEAAPRSLAPDLFEASVRAAALDGSLHSEERRRLTLLAEACGLVYEPARIAAAIVEAREGQ